VDHNIELVVYSRWKHALIAISIVGLVMATAQSSEVDLFASGIVGHYGAVTLA
jgi:hypothetical protein